jgi:hypothetical protein
MQNAESVEGEAAGGIWWFHHSAFFLLHSLRSASIGSTNAARRAGK